MTRRAMIVGSGSALPKRRVSNAQLAETVETSDEWIVERTGIRARHLAGVGETTATLATKTVEAAARARSRDAPNLEGMKSLINAQSEGP